MILLKCSPFPVPAGNLARLLLRLFRCLQREDAPCLPLVVMAVGYGRTRTEQTAVGMGV